MAAVHLDLFQTYLTEFSQHIDENQPVSAISEAVTWARLAKISEQAGEALGDHMRAKGQNVLKEDLEVSHEDVADRVLSVAFAALATYEHLTSHQGRALEALLAKIQAMNEGLDNSVAEPPSGV